MARDILRVWLHLDRIHCYDEADGWGDAEPYLWTVFFKIDGTTVRLLESLQLSGSTTLHTTPGSHGNLGTEDVDPGDTVTIPAVIGEWETILQPIPVPSSIRPLAEDLPGIIGVVCVLMEEDNVTDDGAEAGHRALDNAVQTALNEIIATRSLTNQEVTDEELEQFKKTIKDKVASAVQKQQNFFEDLWSWLNEDDTIGTQIWFFDQDDLASNETKNFSERWKNEGDWELFGHINATVLCPANAARFTLAHYDMGGDIDLEALRAFQDETFPKQPELQLWWENTLTRNSPQLTYAMEQDPEVRSAAARAIQGTQNAIAYPDKPLPDQLLDDFHQLLMGLKKTGNRRARIDVSRALSAIPKLRGKSLIQAADFLASVKPARYP